MHRAALSVRAPEPAAGGELLEQAVSDGDSALGWGLRGAHTSDELGVNEAGGDRAEGD